MGKVLLHRFGLGRSGVIASSVLLLFLFLHSTESLSCRRSFLKQSLVCSIPALVAAAAAAAAAATPAHASTLLLSSATCSSGVGDDCQELAGDNEFIKKLQLKSAANRELYQQQSLEAYNMKNYPGVFAAMNPPRFLVKKQADGSFAAITQEELTEYQAQGKIKLEKPTAMGGKTMDLTQKPIMVLVD